MKRFFQTRNQQFWCRLIWWVGVTTVLSLCLTDAWAGDVLSGTTDDVVSTIQGSGKRWLYLMEGVSAVMVYIKSKNVFVFGGVAVVALFLNVLLHLAGTGGHHGMGL